MDFKRFGFGPFQWQTQCWDSGGESRPGLRKASAGFPAPAAPPAPRQTAPGFEATPRLARGGVGSGVAEIWGGVSSSIFRDQSLTFMLFGGCLLEVFWWVVWMVCRDASNLGSAPHWRDPQIRRNSRTWIFRLVGWAFGWEKFQYVVT